MIEAYRLTKRYGEKTAVDGLDFTVRPGVVTGFLGPNGAGKSTTMRMIVGLDAPSSGSVTVNGRRYAEHSAPLQELGALLEAVAGKRAGGLSLGMGQRLGIAAALLGDPETVMLDEPVNGLDPEGVLWIRNLLIALAGEGRTVFVSSHLMSEMALVAEHLVIIGRGRLLADTTVTELVGRADGDTVTVASADPAKLREVPARPGVRITGRAETLRVTGMSSRTIGSTAAEHGIALHELTAQTGSLEQAFMDLTRDSVEYHGGTGIESLERAA